VATGSGRVNLMPGLSIVESFLISSDLIPLSPQSVSSHLISTHLMSSEFFRLISALRSSCHLISAYLMSFHFLPNQLALLSYFMVVHLMSKHLISHQFFLHLPFPNPTGHRSSFFHAGDTKSSE
jgi:hypothetical protein